MLLLSLAAESSRRGWGGIGSALRLMTARKGAGIRFVEAVPAAEHGMDGGVIEVATLGLGPGENGVYSAPDRRALRAADARTTCELVAATGRPRAVLAHNEELVPMAAELARRLGVSCVYCSHSDLSVEHPARDDARELQAVAVEVADLVVAFSPSHAEHLRRAWRAPATFLPLPLAELRDRDGDDRRPRRRSGRAVLAAGRAVPQKGFDVLLRALPALPPDVVVNLAVGRGDPATERTVAELASLDRRVRLLGWQEEDRLRQLLLDADVVAVPSRFEPLGLFAAETIVARTPVVMTARCGLAELVRPHVVTVPSDDVDALAAEITLALDGGGRSDWAAARNALATYTFDCFVDAFRETLARC